MKSKLFLLFIICFCIETYVFTDTIQYDFQGRQISIGGKLIQYDFQGRPISVGD